jgi:hypothetical protein
MDGRVITFAIPESAAPLNATEVQLLSMVGTGYISNAAWTIATLRVSTTRLGRVFPVYQQVASYAQSAVSYDSSMHWFPIGNETLADRNVTYFSDKQLTGHTEVFISVTGYRV